MKAIFNQPCELEIVERLDDNDEPIFSCETFAKDEVVEFELIDHPQKFNGETFVDDPELWNVQFGDGSMALGVSRSWFDLEAE